MVEWTQSDRPTVLVLQSLKIHLGPPGRCHLSAGYGDPLPQFPKVEGFLGCLKTLWAPGSWVTEDKEPSLVQWCDTKSQNRPQGSLIDLGLAQGSLRYQE